MRLAWFLYPLKWLLALGLVGGLFAAAYFVNAEMQAERAREAAGDKVQSPRRAKGDTVSLDAESAERYGLKEEPVAAVQWHERVPVYGQVVPNPRATSEVRAPYAGTLRADAKVSWPVPGQSVRAGQTLAWVDLRLPPQERLTIQDNLNSARLKKEGDQRVVLLQRERVDRLDKIAKSQIGPQQLVDDALVLLENAKTQLAVDAAAVELWQTALADIDAPGGRKSSAYSQPLLAPADGEIVDLLARPGASVEPGAVVAQVVDFRHPLVRLDIPPRALPAGPPAIVRLETVPANPPGLDGVLSRPGATGTVPSVEAALVGPAPRVDVASQFAGYWYAIDPAALAGGGSAAGVVWRPGLQVKAFLIPPAATARPAVTVPAAAVLFHQGVSLVFVRVAPGRYERREVRLLSRDGDRWVLDARAGAGQPGVSPGEVVVTAAAQVLLSELLRDDGGEPEPR